ncbi:BAG family molecular chaperone regulator 1 [Brachypodium distachyon]|uniref:BAG domain-containing protein n=1 Tax=Brachypodium distachyon TaxID=15368 RepID=A0A0Q3L922_BRADI|nr:BAG family molecular chaperone regulator 1 [Brachypodium distachyon]KQK19641.1 hypothetical protein BRADI_1g49537v3 [Brachypodium distachyon]|eukprot:XP_014753284.1 BAG family molecular chaperone regulator 1 [Brachypodium distachyon]
MLGVIPKSRRAAAAVELGSPPTMKKKTSPPSPSPATVAAGGKVAAEEVWEVRPGGMLVQKRDAGGDEEIQPALSSVKPVPTIRVKVKQHGGATHEIYISAEATFGELRKMVAERTGAHPEDLKVSYKDKARDPKAFLDMAGVKDRSRIAVADDPEARARRLVEERREGHLRKAAAAVSAVAAEVDKIAPKVEAMEASVRKGEKVAEKDLVTVTELLMNELLKLDAVVAGGDVKAQRRVQVKRVQKYVETLDAVAAKNAAIVCKPAAGKQKPQPQPQPQSLRQQQPPQQQTHRQQQQQQTQRQQQQQQQPTRWEMFDLLSSLPSTSSAASSTTTVSSTASSGAPPQANRLDWML